MFNVPPRFLPDEQSHRMMLGDCLAGVMTGKINNTGSVTLNSNQTTTKITDARLTRESVVLLMPTTAHAAAALATTYVATQENGYAIITHASNSQADRIFRFAIMG